MLIDKRPNVDKAVIVASGKIRGRVIECDLARTLTLTGRVKYNASGTVAMKVNLYYSPDGTNFDTVVYTTFNVTITAGTICQVSKNIDIPELGYIATELENADTVYTITQAMLWANVSKWWEDVHKAIEPNLIRRE